MSLYLQGFNRIFNNIADISIDVPNAYTLLESCATECHREGIIDSKILKDVPQRYAIILNSLYAFYKDVLFYFNVYSNEMLCV